MLRKAAAALTQRVFGGTCVLCRGVAGHGLLCTACDADLPRLSRPLCPRCAVPSAAGAVCGRCLARAPRFDATIAALEYRFPADVLVHALKFRGELALAALLARLLEERIASDPPVHFVVPVPLAAQRLRERGYNQALEIARHVAQAAGARLKKMMAMGASRPWPEALKALTGEDRMDATAILDYFAPLKKWLDEQNKGQKVGW